MYTIINNCPMKKGRGAFQYLKYNTIEIDV